VKKLTITFTSFTSGSDLILTPVVFFTSIETFEDPTSFFEVVAMPVNIKIQLATIYLKVKKVQMKNDKLKFFTSTSSNNFLLDRRDNKATLLHA
jgi:hypothetical protein